jgi:hypothetical protein
MNAGVEGLVAVNLCSGSGLCRFELIPSDGKLGTNSCELNKLDQVLAF